MDSHAHELAQPAQLPARRESAIQQTVLQVFGEAARIHAVRLPALQRGMVAGFYQHQIESGPFADVPYRNPAHSRGLHDHLSDAMLPQPLAQPHKILGKRSKHCFFTFDIRTAVQPMADADRDRLRMRIQTCTTAITDI